eukprot:CAMPEP_0194195754 /NCGR_PEP_ID=MMETSP0154-20130528/76304_1 /TAXON_ID=1049557 /ORGANISM="Thalassiothrix antarctica, Strain L6-D1" /LENGTH=385 /DNA_ID=CAMNT_0038920303 /DNA_START=123 /DNA_END=1280 /DNA_ORIENTATION=+
MKVIIQKAAKSAFRGGISGAIAMVLQVVLLMWLRTVVYYQYSNGGTIGHVFATLYADGGILRFYQGAQYAFLQASGAIAMVLQVVLLMWLRTVINYQYRNGGTIGHAFATLYADGGILRFYQGAQYAFLQGPLSRFGDTAANEGVKELLGGMELSMGIVTAFASFVAALWRMTLTPLDTLKTTLQVGGEEGMKGLRHKIATNGLFVLYDGALGNWAATLVGHYPWFVVNNQLEKVLPAATTPRSKLLRRAFIGFCSSVVSDCISNSIRVAKTVKQTSEVQLTYIEAIQQVMHSSGITGLLFRGLEVKLFSNALSSILFSIMWKMIMDKLQKREREAATTSDDTSSADLEMSPATSKKAKYLLEDDETLVTLLSSRYYPNIRRRWP